MKTSWRVQVVGLTFALVGVACGGHLSFENSVDPTGGSSGAGGSGGKTIDGTGGSTAGSGGTVGRGSPSPCGCLGPACDCSSLNVQWGTDIGSAASYEFYEVVACEELIARRWFLNDSPVLNCQHFVDWCTSSLSVNDFMTALTNPDVRDAFAAAPIVYGSDPRPIGEPMFYVGRLEGPRVKIGQACSPASTDPCLPIPPAVAALRQLLEKLSAQENARPRCLDNQ